MAGGAADLTWLLGPVDPAASGFTSDTAVLTAWSGRAHVTVTPRSACGNPHGAGLAVAIGLAGPGSVSPTVGGADGTYGATVDVTPCPVEAATQVTARVGAVDLPPLELAIACVAPSAEQTEVVLDRAALELCDDPALDQVAVVVTPRDAAGALMGAGNQVSLAMAGLTGGAVTDAGDGSYTASLSAADCEVSTPRPLTVRVNGVDLAPAGAELTVTCAPVDGGASGVSVAGGPGVADASTPLQVTVAAVNTCDRPARGRAVQLATTLGTLGAPAGTTDAAGTHRSSLTSSTAGAATLSATVDGVAVATAGVTFEAPPSGGGGGGCSSGGGAGLAALGLVALGLVRRMARRREG
jgi:adhesin/invasin